MKMTEEEKKSFGELYEHVRSNVFHYDKNQSLPSSLVLSLKGLKTGKVVENKKIKDKANYSYDDILVAFKLSDVKIQYAIKTKNFKTETQAFRYIRKIVESNLNDAYLINQRIINAQKEVKDVRFDNLENNKKARYQKKTKNKDLDIW